METDKNMESNVPNTQGVWQYVPAGYSKAGGGAGHSWPDKGLCLLLALMCFISVTPQLENHMSQMVLGE